MPQRISQSRHTSSSSQDEVSTSALQRFFIGTIFNKIVMPFLLLTLVVAVGGTFVVTRIVAANVQDRLTNLLINTGQAAADSVVAIEQNQIDTLRLAVFTLNIPESLIQGDEPQLNRLMTVLAQNQSVDLMVAIMPDGRVAAGIKRADSDYITGWLVGQDLSVLPMVESVLNQEIDEFGDKFAGALTVDNEAILMTVAPVYDGSGKFAGAMAIGIPMKRVLDETKLEVLADLTYHQSDGKAIETTFSTLGNKQDTLAELDVSPAFISEALANPEGQLSLSEIVVNEREFQTVYVPLRIRNDTIGLLGVSLPTTVVTTLITTNRTGLSVLFALIAGLIVLVGYVVARNLSDPIRRLASSAEEVRSGNLEVKSGVRTSDEIGLLGRTFDAMTERLSTQTRALEVAYQEQQKETSFLTAVLSSASDGIVVLAPDGEVTRINPVAKALIGTNQDLWLDTLTDLLKQALAGDVARARIEANGEWFDAVTDRIYEQEGEALLGILISIRNVTDQVLTEQMRTAFIFQISHELRTPLTAAKGFNDLVKMLIQETQTEIRNYASQLGEQLDTLVRMINQILAVTQLVRSESPGESGQANINSIIKTIIDEYRTPIRDKGISLKVELSEIPICIGDAERLRWAFEEIIKNAVNYTQPGRPNEITIRTDFQNGVTMIEVVDTGIGITKRDQEHIFEQFYRGSATTPEGGTIDIRGAGLGLFIVDKVVEAHQGHIQLRSQVGHGTAISLHLPCRM